MLDKKFLIRLPRGWFETIEEKQDTILPGKRNKSKRGAPGKMGEIFRQAVKEYAARKGVWLDDA